MDIEGLGESAVDVLLANRMISTIPELYDVDKWESDLCEVEGFGKTSVSNLRDAIGQSKSQPLSRLLVALAIPHVGIRTAELLAERFGDMRTLQDASVDQLDKVLSELSPRKLSDSTSPRTDVKMPRAVHEFLRRTDVSRLIDELRKHGVKGEAPERKGEVTKHRPFAGKTIVVTGSIEGFTRKEIQDLIKQLGGTPTGSVSKKTDLVIVGESPGSKLDKANELGLETMDGEAFRELASER